MHPEVSVLYADIVNFTPLTATLSSGNLVSLLNELFGKFDEAARVIELSIFNCVVRKLFFLK